MSIQIYVSDNDFELDNFNLKRIMVGFNEIPFPFEGIMTKLIEIGFNYIDDIGLCKEMVQGKDSVEFGKFQYFDPKYLKPEPNDTDGRREIYEKGELIAKWLSNRFERNKRYL